MKKNYLLDQEFLHKLDLEKNKTTYAKIILLTFNEDPISEIQGKITAGSINIDGTSAVRRTCSLTMVSPEVDITNTYWALNNKFKLEIGVENTIDQNYPNILWFKQGTYVFTSLSMSVTANNFTVSLNGKDKMCLLNGEVGGAINASTDFGQLEEYSYVGDQIVRNIVSIPIVDIIKNAVHTYAGEPLSNIVLNDIDNYGLELLEYRGDQPMYMIRNITTDEVSNMTFDSNYLGCDQSGEKEVEYNFLDPNFKFYNESDAITAINSDATIMYVKINGSTEKFNVMKVEYGMTAGYRKTDLTYPGPLVANIGESLVSILDKIKNMFADFEYFYDIDGRFIFQKKKTYINTSFNNLKTSDNETYANDALYTSATVYSFEDGILLSAFSDNPQILNIKNDFSIWGKRKGVTGTDIPVHMRYAIDKKPVYYKQIKVNDNNEQESDAIIYISENFVGETTEKMKEVDWREIIYQMANDYFKYNHKLGDFTQRVAENNPDYYSNGRTGYENYYTDLQGFWRQIYNPDALGQTGIVYNNVGLLSETEFNNNKEKYYISNPDGTYTQCSSDSVYNASIYYYTKDDNSEWIELEVIKGLSTDMFSNKTGLNQNVTKHPETLNFWFDFMDTQGELGKYSVQAIGSRPKAANNDKVNSIYFQETPTVLFLTEKDYNDLMNNREDYNDMTGYTFINLTQQMENYFTISSQGKSAKDELDNLLYQHTCATEAVNLTAMPIYYLEPNARIYINDKNTGINGEFIVSKITVPLQYNGTTAITTTRAVTRIY